MEPVNHENFRFLLSKALEVLPFEAERLMTDFATERGFYRFFTSEDNVNNETFPAKKILWGFIDVVSFEDSFSRHFYPVPKIRFYYGIHHGEDLCSRDLLNMCADVLQEIGTKDWGIHTLSWKTRIGYCDCYNLDSDIFFSVNDLEYYCKEMEELGAREDLSWGFIEVSIDNYKVRTK